MMKMIKRGEGANYDRGLSDGSELIFVGATFVPVTVRSSLDVGGGGRGQGVDKEFRKE
jgi:hypothetical protein